MKTELDIFEIRENHPPPWHFYRRPGPELNGRGSIQLMDGSGNEIQDWQQTLGKSIFTAELTYLMDEGKSIIKHRPCPKCGESCLWITDVEPATFKCSKCGIQGETKNIYI